MKMCTHLICLLALLAVSTAARAQQDAEDTNGVVIHADPRLAIVTAPKSRVPIINTSGSRTGLIRSGRGFRVQIYNGNDRNKANALKVDFIRRYPSVRTYMSYIQPQFRVKVGDFRTRAEAQHFLQEINRIYSPVMIVPDIIVINTFRDDQQNQREN